VAIEERYPAIVQAALETFARRGYHQASIREIARAADLSLAGLYHYVRGKDELLFLVIDRSLDSTRFRDATSWAPPAWPELVRRMHAEAPTAPRGVSQ